MFFWDTFVSSFEKHLIEENKKYWSGKSDVTEGNEWIYVIHATRPAVHCAVREDICAKGLQAKENLPIASILCRDGCRQLFSDLDMSFGIKQQTAVFQWDHSPFWSKIRTAVVGKYLAVTTYGNKHKLFKMKYRKIPCGDAIHDTIIRMNTYCKAGFDCFDLDKRAYYKYIRDAISVIDSAYRIFKKRRPKYIVVTEAVYNERLIQHVGNKFGAEILIQPSYFADTIIKIKNKSDYAEKAKTAFIVGVGIEKYLENHRIRLDDNEDNFLYNFHSENKIGIKQKLGIKNGKKNVFILSHCIPDSPRVSVSQNVFDEYNDWLLGTIRIIKNIPEVNWIIKDHPQSSWYKQDAYFEKIRRENTADNIYWCDKTVSGKEIREVADCVITCAGDPGVEYWAYGIPTICMAKLAYVNRGISYCMKSLEEYSHTLKEIGKLQKPSIQSREEAKKFIYAYKMLGESSNPVDALFCETTALQRNILNHECDDEYYFQILNAFCKKYLEFLHTGKIEKSNVFNLKNVYSDD